MNNSQEKFNQYMKEISQRLNFGKSVSGKRETSLL